jgi:hypothetical protein
LLDRRNAGGTRKVVLGLGEVCPGLELAVASMRKGERSRFLVQVACATSLSQTTSSQEGTCVCACRIAGHAESRRACCRV